MSDWKRVPVTEVCEFIVDCVNKTAPSVDYKTSYKMIRTPNIKAGRVDLSDCRFVEKEIFYKWTRRAKVENDDILLTREAPLGEVGIVNTNENIFLGQRIMQYRANREVLNPRFLLYSFLSKDLQNQFRAHDGSGSVVSHIRVPDCLKFEICIPSIGEQNRIVDILGSIDNKIELNRQTNQTLEHITQAIFKFWFIDFEPVKAKIQAKKNGQDPERAAMCAISGKTDAELDAYLKASTPEHDAQGSANVAGGRMPGATRQQLTATAALFPDEFEDSELGLIPKGWHAGELGDIAHNVREGVNPTDESPETPYVGLEHIEKKQIYITNWGYADQVESNKSRFNAGDILFGKLRPYFHKVCIMQFDGICSTDILVIRPIKSDWTGFVQHLVFDKKFVDSANLHSTGTRMPRANWKDMSQYPIAIPDADLAVAYTNLVSRFNHFAGNNISNSKTLSSLRDLLLPKLLSGEIILTESESKTGAVA